MREQLQGLVPGGSSSPRSRRHQWVQSGARLPLDSLINETSTRVAASVSLSWLLQLEQQRSTEPSDRIARLAALNEELQSSHDVPQELLREAFARYTIDVQRLVYDSVFARMTSVLERVPAMECWSKEDDASASLSDLPSFSTLPQDYITVVADLLLSLLPQLEPFASSSSLPLAAAASRQVDAVCAQEWTTWATALPSSVHLSASELECCRRLFCLDDGVATEEEQQDAAAQFVDAWTGVMASGTTAALLTAIARMPSLSSLGAKQLAADVGYFANVLSALGFGGDDNFVVKELHATLERCSIEELQSRAEELRSAMAAEDNGDDERHKTRDRVTLALVEMVRSRREAATAASERQHDRDPHRSEGSQFF
ncbi:hypothetical protein PINS_up009826 [Pythium insidiosum]|nr:hypothetical protein PINS_up009826 [Pythium insidiosum]